MRIERFCNDPFVHESRQNILLMRQRRNRIAFLAINQSIRIAELDSRRQFDFLPGRGIHAVCNAVDLHNRYVGIRSRETQKSHRNRIIPPQIRRKLCSVVQRNAASSGIVRCVYKQRRGCNDMSVLCIDDKAGSRSLAVGRRNGNGHDRAIRARIRRFQVRPAFLPILIFDIADIIGIVTAERRVAIIFRERNIAAEIAGNRRNKKYCNNNEADCRRK